jgi:peroxiredoxin
MDEEVSLTCISHDDVFVQVSVTSESQMDEEVSLTCISHDDVFVQHRIVGPLSPRAESSAFIADNDVVRVEVSVTSESQMDEEVSLTCISHDDVFVQHRIVGPLSPRAESSDFIADNDVVLVRAAVKNKLKNMVY